MILGQYTFFCMAVVYIADIGMTNSFFSCHHDVHIHILTSLDIETDVPIFSITNKYINKLVNNYTLYNHYKTIREHYRASPFFVSISNLEITCATYVILHAIKSSYNDVFDFMSRKYPIAIIASSYKIGMVLEDFDSSEELFKLLVAYNKDASTRFQNSVTDLLVLLDSLLGSDTYINNDPIDDESLDHYTKTVPKSGIKRLTAYKHYTENIL